MASRIAKERFRGDNPAPQEDTLSNVKKELGDVFFFWLANCNNWGLDPLEVIQGNVLKLQDRAARNVIQGNGDNR